MKLKPPRKYSTTFFVFVFLLLVILLVFFLTPKTSSVKGSISYEQFSQTLQNSPGQIEQVELIADEPVVYVKLKGETFRKQILVPQEEKSSLVKALTKAGVSVIVSLPDKKSSFWWEVRLPGFSVGEP